MEPGGSSGLASTDPRVGDTLLFDGLEWKITDHSSYWSDEGHRVIEWCCETETATAYLLKEVGDREATRWLFTREIPANRVTLAGGQPLGGRTPPGRDAAPPETLTYEGQTYRYASTTEGTYEDEPGERVRKTTWDYWDAPRARNLAVERWPDGRLDCYLGAYIDPGQAMLRPAAGGSEVRPAAAARRVVQPSATARIRARGGMAVGANPFPIVAVSVPLAYLPPFFAGLPLDRSLAFALPVAAVLGWVAALRRAPLTGLAALGLVPALAILFERFHPLTTPIGLAALLAGPMAIVGLARLRRAGGERRAVQYLAAFAVTVPLLLLGLYHYFQFAPGPHTLGQWVLALGPAALGGLVAVALAGLGLADLPQGAP